MKKFIKVAIYICLFLCFLSCGAFLKKNTFQLEKEVEEKIVEMQRLIDFNDEQAFKLKKIEVEYLRESNKVKKCQSCDKDILLEKLQRKRDIQLQNILKRDEYIKYDAVENDRIKSVPIRAN